MCPSCSTLVSITGFLLARTNKHGGKERGVKREGKKLRGKCSPCLSGSGVDVYMYGAFGGLSRANAERARATDANTSSRGHGRARHRRYRLTILKRYDRKSIERTQSVEPCVTCERNHRDSYRGRGMQIFKSTGQEELQKCTGAGGSVTQCEKRCTHTKRKRGREREREWKRREKIREGKKWVAWTRVDGKNAANSSDEIYR